MDAFEALSDPVRRDLLLALRRGDLSAGDLAASQPGVSRPGVSRHLRVLREAGLVAVVPDGRRRVYSLRPDALAPVSAIVAALAGVVPPVPARALDGLDLEVRRTTRERRAEPGAGRHEEIA
ncbi:metalloregulator ArsR/SmtB family transcription factor [Cellulosimicrobium sp. Marseille-Q4280]|uniref:ArsR/SmtB family transcription factor n=1 Tax=Cellulosimicrobium sp. Marseille-Q4280 TaxID=2937992 RepID=UPI002041DD33|nr:metalloregulator ArsR/SmtB family transcription factor [Cellulosimicrobium sp. Marseille-Q4280]